MKAEVWALWTVDGAQLIACVQQTEGEIEGLSDDRWITLEKVCLLSVQIGITNRGPVVVPVSLPFAASSDECARVRVRVSAVSSIWWFADMPEKVRAEMRKRIQEATRAAGSLAASAAGIVT